VPSGLPVVERQDNALGQRVRLAAQHKTGGHIGLDVHAALAHAGRQQRGLGLVVHLERADEVTGIDAFIKALLQR